MGDSSNTGSLIINIANAGPDTKKNAGTLGAGSDSISNKNMTDTTLSIDGGWPIWAQCVACYAKTFGGIGGGAEDDMATKVQKLYGERDFFFLPCSHVVCSLQCLQSCRRPAIPGSEQLGSVQETEYGDSNCPSCDNAFVEATILTGITLRPLEVIGRAVPQTVRLNKKCEGCIRKNVLSIQYCEDCSAALCKHCADQHAFMIDTTKHSLTESPNVYDVVSKSEICTEHPSQIVKAYCNDCDLQLCQMCISEAKHTQHATCDFKALTQKTVETLKAISNEHRKAANEFHVGRENFPQQFQVIDERLKQFQSQAIVELTAIPRSLIQQESDICEDIICAVTTSALKMNEPHALYKSLISQAEVFRLFTQIFNFVDLPKNKNKFELLSHFFNLMKERVKHVKMSVAQLSEELPSGDITLNDHTEKVIEAIDEVYSRIEMGESRKSTSTPLSDIAGIEINPSNCSISAVSERMPRWLIPSPNPTSIPSSSSPLNAKNSHPTPNSKRKDSAPLTEKVGNAGEVTSATPLSETSSGMLLPNPLSAVSAAMDTTEDILSPYSTSTDAFKPIILNSSNPEFIPTEKSASSSTSGSAYRHTILEPESDDTDDDAQRVAFMCDFEDSSDEERVRIKREPVDYDDRDEEPPDDDEDIRDAPIIIIKKEIDYDSMGNQDYDAHSSEFQNGHTVGLRTRTPPSFYIRSNSNSSSEGERNLILPDHRLPIPRSRVMKKASRAIKLEPGLSAHHRITIIPQAGARGSPNRKGTENKPQKPVRTPENEIMISYQDTESNSKAQDFENEFILPNVPSPLSDKAASDDEFFKNMDPYCANSREQDEDTQLGEVLDLDPQTGLLIRRDSGCVVDADPDIVDPENGKGSAGSTQDDVFEKPDENSEVPSAQCLDDPTIAGPISKINTIVIPMGIISSPSSIYNQVKPGTFTNSPSPPSFNVNSLNTLTPNLLKFANSRANAQEQSKPSVLQRRAVKKGNSTSVEIQTDAPSAFPVKPMPLPIPLGADMNIIKTEPEPYPRESTPSSTVVASSSASTVLTNTTIPIPKPKAITSKEPTELQPPIPLPYQPLIQEASVRVEEEGTTSEVLLDKSLESGSHQPLTSTTDNPKIPSPKMPVLDRPSVIIIPPTTKENSKKKSIPILADQSKKQNAILLPTGDVNTKKTDDSDVAPRLECVGPTGERPRNVVNKSVPLKKRMRYPSHGTIRDSPRPQESNGQSPTSQNRGMGKAAVSPSSNLESRSSLNRIFKSKNILNKNTTNNPTPPAKTPGLNKSVFHEIYDEFLPPNPGVNETESPATTASPGVAPKRKRGRPFKVDQSGQPTDKKTCSQPSQPKKRGRPIGWRKRTESVGEQVAGKSPATPTPTTPTPDQNCKRTRLRSRQSSPPRLQDLIPADKIKIKMEGERPEENGGFDFEFNPDNEVAPPPESTSSSTTDGRFSSRSNSTSESRRGRGSRSVSSLRSSSGSSRVSSPESKRSYRVGKRKKRNRSETEKSARWSARLVTRSQSMESTSQPDEIKNSGSKGSEKSPEKVGVGPKLILTRSRSKSKTPTPNSRPDTPTSICLSVDSL